jgi:hypothetical protein
MYWGCLQEGEANRINIYSWNTVWFASFHGKAALSGLYVL